MTEIAPVHGPELVTYADELAALLVDTVNGGSSVGFLAPLERDEAAAWWRERAGAVDAGHLQVWIARDAERVTGTIGLVRASLPNARHRAEVTKLMVRPSARGQGWAGRCSTPSSGRPPRPVSPCWFWTPRAEVPPSGCTVRRAGRSAARSRSTPGTRPGS